MARASILWEPRAPQSRGAKPILYDMPARATSGATASMLVRAHVISSLIVSVTAGWLSGAPAPPAPPPRLTISKHCNESILASNYNGMQTRELQGFQTREYWEFAAWRTWNGFLKPVLPASPQPSTIVDVGCGFALYDIYVHRHYKHSVKIIYFDQAGPKTTTKKGFKLTGGWHDNVTRKMPFYHHDRSCVTDIAADNGVPPASTQLLEANVENMAALAGSVDVIYSHMSWGFHYPVKTYAAAAFTALRPGGLLLLTLIKAFANKADGWVGTGKDRKYGVKPQQEMADAVAVGFACSMLSNGYRSERLNVMRCEKPR